MIPNIDKLRRDYQKAALDVHEVLENPILQFKKWFEEALESRVLEPNAMTLATADAQNIPSARVVLLKGFDENGFIFFTNYQSRKGEELEQNNRACLLFL